jgi:dipeptidyl aminopeptidase/acylaminoacyl peptidase
MHRIISTGLAICALTSAAWANPLRQQSVTVADIIAASRFSVSSNGVVVTISPDGKKYAFGVISGDVDRDQLIYTIYVGDITGASRPRRLVELRTSGLGPGPEQAVGSSSLGNGDNLPQWKGSGELVLLWADGQDIRQIVRIDATSGALKYLTNEPREVSAFTLDGSRIVYSVHLPPTKHPTDEERTSGYAVTAGGMAEVLRGSDPIAKRYRSGFRVLDIGTGQSKTVTLDGVPLIDEIDLNRAPSMSPDGNWAALAATLDRAPSGWEVFGRDVAARIGGMNEPGGNYLYSKQLRRGYLIDLRTAEAKYLLDAPLNLKELTKFSWSPDSRNLIFGPAFLPNSDVMSTSDKCSLVVEIDTQKFFALTNPCSDIRSFSWLSRNEVVFQARDGRSEIWSVAGRAIAPNDNAANGAGKKQQGVTFSVEQDENTPPVLVRRLGGAKTVIFDPNPGLLNRFRLAKAKPFTWRDPKGRVWKATLYRAAGQDGPGPVVFQTRTAGTEGKFSLTGIPMGLGPFGVPYLAQPLASAGISVLQIPDVPSGQYIKNPSDRAELYQQIYDSAYRELVAQKIADPAKVGLMAHSQSGWWVLYTVTHSTIPYAAVIINDSFDGSYWQTAMTGFDKATVEMAAGVYPDGRGFVEWLNRSPTFNVGRIRCPVLLIAASGNQDIFYWETFARMRAQKIPVELFIGPQFDRGDHVLQNPAQIAGTANRSLWWWKYWLLPERAKGLQTVPKGWPVLAGQLNALRSVERPPLNGDAVEGRSRD